MHDAWSHTWETIATPPPSTQPLVFQGLDTPPPPSPLPCPHAFGPPLPPPPPSLPLTCPPSALVPLDGCLTRSQLPRLLRCLWRDGFTLVAGGVEAASGELLQGLGVRVVAPGVVGGGVPEGSAVLVLWLHRSNAVLRLQQLLEELGEEGRKGGGTL